MESILSGGFDVIAERARLPRARAHAFLGDLRRNQGLIPDKRRAITPKVNSLVLALRLDDGLKFDLVGFFMLQR